VVITVIYIPAISYTISPGQIIVFNQLIKYDFT
jgi:hypothetical protein